MILLSALILPLIVKNDFIDQDFFIICCLDLWYPWFLNCLNEWILRFMFNLILLYNIVESCDEERVRQNKLLSLKAISVSTRLKEELISNCSFSWVNLKRAIDFFERISIWVFSLSPILKHSSYPFYWWDA